MSDHSEFEVHKGLDPAAFVPGKTEGEGSLYDRINLHMDNQAYFLGEVPQAHLVDPEASLPLNSDRLIGSVNRIEQLLFDIGALVEEEVALIQKAQKRIAAWEDRIEQNRASIEKNDLRIRQANIEILYDKKNRDYWISRGEEVEVDYQHAFVAARPSDWAWLVKKYGLKNSDCTEIDCKAVRVQELCESGAKLLANRYRDMSGKYESARKEKETQNSKLIRTNAELAATNETLQGYIAALYMNEIEPLQDGVLLLKELALKIKALGQQENATYGHMRAWAESFLNSFLRTNARAPQRTVTAFRALTSIPLPPEYC